MLSNNNFNIENSKAPNDCYVFETLIKSYRRYQISICFLFRLHRDFPVSMISFFKSFEGKNIQT